MPVMDELFQYVKKNSNLVRTVELKPNQNDRARILMCDLNSVVAWLLLTSSNDYRVSTVLDISSFTSKMATFVRFLRNVDVEPVFFCDAMTSCRNKEEFESSLPGLRSEYYCTDGVRIADQRCASAAKPSVFVRKHSLFGINPLLYVQTHLYLAKLNVNVISVLHNSLGEVASLAAGTSCAMVGAGMSINGNVFAVLSYNVEFTMFPEVRFIHLDHFDLEKSMNGFTINNNSCSKIVCGYLTAQALCNEFHLSETELMDFAIILGNSFSVFINNKHNLLKYLELNSKRGKTRLESIASFIRKYKSPVFENCRKLVFFKDINEEYDSVVSQSIELYTKPQEYCCFHGTKTTTPNYTQNHLPNQLTNWIEERVRIGNLPLYFYGIVSLGVYVRYPFYSDHSIAHSNLHSSTIYLRETLYSILGAERVDEYGLRGNKPFVRIRGFEEASSSSISILEYMRSLPMPSKCELLVSLLVNKISKDHLDTVIRAANKHHVVEDLFDTPSVRSVVIVIALYLLYQKGGFDGESLDVVYFSVLLHVAGVRLSHVPCDHFRRNPYAKDLNVVNGFSYLLQLVYDFAILIGMNQALPLPDSMCNPSRLLDLLELKTASVYCHVCRERYSHVTSILDNNRSVIHVFKMTCSNPSITSHQIMMGSVYSFDDTVTEVLDHRKTLELPLPLCEKPAFNNISDMVPHDYNDYLSLTTSIASSSLDNITISKGSEDQSTDDQDTEDQSTDEDSSSDLADVIVMAENDLDEEAISLVLSEDFSIDTGFEPCTNIESLSVTDVGIQLECNVEDSQDTVSTSSSGTSTPVTNELSVLNYRAEIIQLVRDHRVVCIEGEAGCGKSTMVPQFILDSNLSRYCKIIVCQPRRVSVVNLAAHVSRMRSERHGGGGRGVVAYCIGGSQNVSPNARIIYSTTGHFLQVLLHKPEAINEYSHVILDEIHDRTITYDFVTLLLRKLLSEGLDCKLILMSATMQSSLFLTYFKEAVGRESVSMPLYVGNRCYPVEEYFIDEINEAILSNPYGYYNYAQEASISHVSLMLANRNLDVVFNRVFAESPRVLFLAQEFCTELVISQSVRGMSILVFLPGISEILDYFDFLVTELQGRKMDEYFSVFVLHSQIPIDEQEELLKPPPSDKVHVILSTNLAENSITIPMLHVVVNFGLQKASKYDYKRKMTRLKKGWCSKAACVQRKGRVGRLLPGRVFHLFPKQFYESVLPDYEEPEISSHSLAKTILQARVIGESIGINAPSEVLKLAIQPPSLVEMDAAVTELVDMGALLSLANGEASETGPISLLGQFSISLPLDIDLCRLILYGLFFGCPIDAVIMAAGLSLKQDCFTLPSRIVMKDQDTFLSSLSKSIDTRLALDDGRASDPMMFVKVFWEWIKFFRVHCDNGLTKNKLVINFSKIYAVQNQRFLQFLSNVRFLADKVMLLIPSTHPYYEQLGLLSKLNDGGGTSLDNLNIHLVVQKDMLVLRTLLVATFMQNLLFGVQKTESPVDFERTEAKLGMLRISESGFDFKNSIVMAQHDNRNRTGGDIATVRELVDTILPGCPKRIDFANNLAVIEFPNTPSTLKKVILLWQFCERRYRWTLDNTSIVFHRPYHPLELTWFRWSAQMEKVDILTWRNRTGLICDFSSERSQCIAVASSLEGNESQTHVKAKFLTILPSYRRSKLTVLLLMAFQPRSSSVLFSIDHLANTVQSVMINSQELMFGLHQEITATDLLVINALRRNLSLLLHKSTDSRRHLPVSDFTKTQEVLQTFLKRKTVQQQEQNEQLLPLAIADLVDDTTTESRSYYPMYKCSILDTVSIHDLTATECSSSPSKATIDTGLDCNQQGSPLLPHSNQQAPPLNLQCNNQQAPSQSLQYCNQGVSSPTLPLSPHCNQRAPPKSLQYCNQPAPPPTVDAALPSPYCNQQKSSTQPPLPHCDQQALPLNSGYTTSSPLYSNSHLSNKTLLPAPPIPLPLSPFQRAPPPISSHATPSPSCSNYSLNNFLLQYLQQLPHPIPSQSHHSTADSPDKQSQGLLPIPCNFLGNPLPVGPLPPVVQSSIHGQWSSASGVSSRDGSNTSGLYSPSTGSVDQSDSSYLYTGSIDQSNSNYPYSKDTVDSIIEEEEGEEGAVVNDGGIEETVSCVSHNYSDSSDSDLEGDKREKNVVDYEVSCIESNQKSSGDRTATFSKTGFYNGDDSPWVRSPSPAATGQTLDRPKVNEANGEQRIISMDHPHSLSSQSPSLFQFTPKGKNDEVEMSDIERKVVTYIYTKGRTVTLSSILGNMELRMLEFLEDELLSVQFFLSRRNWFKVAELNLSNSENSDYIITLINLVPKYV